MAVGTQASSTLGTGSEHVVRLVDHFKHIGPNGTHVCMVFEPMGANLLSLIKHYNYHGVPIELVRRISRQVWLKNAYINLKPAGLYLLCPILFHHSSSRVCVLIHDDVIHAHARRRCGMHTFVSLPVVCIHHLLVQILTPSYPHRGNNQTRSALPASVKRRRLGPTARE